MRTKLRLEDGDLIVQRTQDCQPILERNAQLRSQSQNSDWGRHVASIPCVILEKWIGEEWARGNTTIKLFGPEFDRLVARKLRDPDYKWLRTDK